MKNRLLISLFLFFLLSTITFKEKITIIKFNINKIIIDNNFLLKDKDIKKLLVPIYNENLMFIDNKDIETALMQNDFIDRFSIKKKYPNTLKIKIFEKKPIAILVNKKEKFYLSEKIELIEYENIKEYQNLPYVFGNKEKFEIFYKNLQKIDFPFNLIKKYTFYESQRWDLETINKKVIKLNSKKYLENIKNYLKLREKNSFKKYEVFDYRIDNQLILK